jgi:hypothetical protein
VGSRGDSVLSGFAKRCWESSFRALDPAAEAEVSRPWAGMLPVVLGNLKSLIEQR